MKSHFVLCTAFAVATLAQAQVFEDHTRVRRLTESMTSQNATPCPSGSVLSGGVCVPLIQNQGNSWTRNFLGQKKVLAVNRHGYETSVLISQTGEVIHRVPVCATSAFFCTQYTYRDINLGVPVGSNPVFIQNGVIEVTNNSATCKSTSSSQGLYAKPIATSLTSGPTSWNVVFEGVVATSETPITSGSNCGDGWNGL